MSPLVPRSGETYTPENCICVSYCRSELPQSRNKMSETGDALKGKRRYSGPRGMLEMLHCARNISAIGTSQRMLKPNLGVECSTCIRHRQIQGEDLFLNCEQLGW